MGCLSTKESLDGPHIIDKKSKKKYLIDETKEVSTVPRKWDYRLFLQVSGIAVTLDNEQMEVYGVDIELVDFGLRHKEIRWPFFITNCENAVIGLDFLRAYPELREKIIT